MILYADHCPISFIYTGTSNLSYISFMTTYVWLRRINYDYYRNDETPLQVGDFEAKLEPVLTKMEADLAQIKADNPDTWFEDVYRMYKDRTNWFNYTDTYSNLIINGLVLQFKLTIKFKKFQ